MLKIMGVAQSVKSLSVCDSKMNLAGLLAGYPSCGFAPRCARKDQRKKWKGLYTGPPNPVCIRTDLRLDFQPFLESGCLFSSQRGVGQGMRAHKTVGNRA